MQNQWISYFDRTYQQIKLAILSRVATLVPEMTDLNESNIFIKMSSIWAGLIEMLGYYVDNAARECHLQACRLYESGIRIAYVEDYRVKGYRASSALVVFTIDAAAPSDILIPTGTIVKTAANRFFRTVEDATILTGAVSVFVDVEQITDTVTGYVLGTINGTDNQKFTLPNKDITDYSIDLTVGGISWMQQETLGYSAPTARHFRQSVDKDKNLYIELGDGINGRLGTIGQSVECSFKRCDGADGNVLEQTITTVVSTITLPSGVTTLTVTNPNAASGGAFTETLEELKYRIPRAVRTLLRAVTPPDYKDLAELANGVSRSLVEFSCGKTVVIYIVPEGGGIATDLLCASVEGYFEDKKMITTKVVVLPAGEVRLQLTLNIRVRHGYNPTTVLATVKAALADFVSYRYQVISGKVNLSDLYEVIEGVEGVNFSEITAIVVVPYARPIVGTTTPLDWTRTTPTTSVGTHYWRILMLNSTSFQLFKDNNYVGTYSTSTLIALDEIEFTLNPIGYTAGEQWTFVTYPYNNGTLTLSEPSLPITLVSDITTNLI